MKNKDYKKTEENVHILKHKIIIFEFKDNYKIANKFEHDLRELNLDRVEKFNSYFILLENYLDLMDCIIVDDEQMARVIIKTLCDELKFLKVVGEFSNAMQTR